jgi:hypothetical protein
MASSRPNTAASTITTGRRASRRARALSLVAVTLLLGLLPSAALAASEPTAGYKTAPTTPKTTPSKGVAPSKEEKPATGANEPPPATSPAPASEKASTLPFTGFDLRWDIGVGLLLIAAGVSIVVLQRRQRRDSAR